jgi:hypothetical protein
MSDTITNAILANDFSQALEIGAKMDSIFSDDFICACDENSDCVCVSVDAEYFLFDA